MYRVHFPNKFNPDTSVYIDTLSFGKMEHCQSYSSNSHVEVFNLDLYKYLVDNTKIRVIYLDDDSEGFNHLPTYQQNKRFMRIQRMGSRYPHQHCLFCSKLYRPENNKSYFCSIDCKSGFQYITTRCQVCGKTIANKKTTKAKYCSYKCSGISKRMKQEKINCLVCGKEIDRFVTSQKERKYCSTQCLWNRNKTLGV